MNRSEKASRGLELNECVDKAVRQLERSLGMMKMVLMGDGANGFHVMYCVGSLSVRRIYGSRRADDVFLFHNAF